MKIIPAGYERIQIPDPVKKIEKIARVCYKSEDKIGEGTDVKMVNDLLDRNHLAMIEHADAALFVCKQIYVQFKNLIGQLESVVTKDTEQDPNLKQQYIRFTEYHGAEGGFDVTERYIISGNLRAWYETIGRIYKYFKWMPEAITKQLDVYTRDVFNFGQWACETSDFIDGWARLITYEDWETLTYEERMVHETFSVLLTVDRGITHEIVRMREASFAQESTRYCNYNAGKYGSEITVIKPCFWEEDSPAYKRWEQSCLEDEAAYIELTKECKCPAQQARDVLPTSVKNDIVVTAHLDEWKHIFRLRACDATGPAHPQMKEVMMPFMKEVRADSHYDGLFNDLVAADEK